MKQERARRGLALRLGSAGLIAAACLSFGCAETPGAGGATVPRQRPEVIRPDGLVEYPVDRGKLLVHPDRGVDGYDDIFVRRTGFSFAEGEKEFPDSDRARLVELLLDSRRARVEAIGQLSASGPGPCTLAMDAFVVDLELYRSSGAPGSRTTIVSSFGSFNYVTELRDSESDEIIVTHGVHHELGSGVGEGKVRPDFDRVARLIDRSTRALAPILRSGVPLTSMDSRADLGCEGRVGKARRAALGL